MIVPGNRLILAVGLLVLPFAAATVAIPSTLVWTKVVLSILLITVLADAIFARVRFTGIQVEMPEVIRMSKGRETEIELGIRNKRLRTGQLRLGLPFPREITSEKFDFVANLEKEVPFSRISWPCRAIKQGRYRLERCYLETVSLLGLWAVRGSVPVHTEIRVYPDLLVELRNLHGLMLNTGFGIQVHRQVGKGREFDHLREYVSGDSYEDIHWKATARFGRPVTKVFQIERVQEIYVIIDASRLSLRTGGLPGSAGISGRGKSETITSTNLEKFITAALVMGIAAERQGDSYGILTFSDKVSDFLKAKSGKAHYNLCRDTLYTLEPQNVTPDFNELFTFIGNRLRRRSLLVFLTSLDDPVLSESFLSNMDILSRRHLVLVNMIKPDAAAPLFSSPAESTNDLIKNLAGHIVWEGLREIGKKLNRCGAGFHMLEDEKICMQLVSRYLEIKQRQLL